MKATVYLFRNIYTYSIHYGHAVYEDNCEYNSYMSKLGSIQLIEVK